ncbi:hypothetical protein D3C81_1855060 [compost metagenome]
MINRILHFQILRPVIEGDPDLGARLHFRNRLGSEINQQRPVIGDGIDHQPAEKHSNTKDEDSFHYYLLR